MMDFDYRAKRLEKEQQKEKEAARRKIQQEKILKEKQQEREKELAEHRQKQEELREKLRLEQEMIDLHVNSLTNGIQFRKHYTHIYEIDTHETEYGDKITLSEDCLVELTELDVFTKDNAVNFQLEISYKLDKSQNAGVRKMITYCGINEFTAPKESIGLPPKIIESIKYHSSLTEKEERDSYYDPFVPPFPLTQATVKDSNLSYSMVSSGNILSNSDIQILSIDLRYIKLPKCQFIKLKPKFHDFYHIEAIKRCLEENLSFHTSLAVNDLLVVKYRGEEFPLLVTAIKPERFGSLKNTDVEVEFDYSEEYEKTQQQQQQTKQEDSTHAKPFVTEAINSLPTSRGHKLGSDITSGETSMEVVQPYENTEITQRIIGNPVKPEPIITAENQSSYLQAKFKLLNGKSSVRKFLHESTLLDIFSYVVQELKAQNCVEENDIPSLQLSISNPTKTFQINEVLSDGKRTLSDLGLAVKSQLFFVQLR